MVRVTLTLSLAATLLGCGGYREAEDAARICFLEPFGTQTLPTEVQLEAGEPLQLHAVASAGCHTDELEVSCEASVDGDVITVTALTSWVRTEPLSFACESILLQAKGVCETPPLDAGTYTVAYATEEVDIEVPGTVGDDCLEPSHTSN